jgi:surface antigen
MYNSDYDVHNAVFVDHLNTSDSGSSYTNWYNKKTGNSGIIHVTRSYMEGPFKCKDYDATVDITNRWPLVGIGGVNRKVVFGTACQTPDGQWIEKP